MTKLIGNALYPWRRSSTLVMIVRLAIALLLAAAAQAIWSPIAAAQEFRIYTRVYQDETAEPAAAAQPRQSNVVARTLTMFHAGKVYDYIESVGEVIIFEPAHERFTILSTSRSLVTQVDLADLAGMLEVADKELRSYVDKPNAEGGPTPEVSQALKFQLAPDFMVDFNPAGGSLKLSSPFVLYEAKAAKPNTPEALAAYLRYADWTCRLNYVLHPQTLFPSSRIELNDALRKHQVIPTEVRLKIAGDIPIELRAEHQIHWQLDSMDRSLIHHWATLLKDRGTRQVIFRDYQKAMLVSLSKRGR